jgi:hypothetical protein
VDNHSLTQIRAFFERPSQDIPPTKPQKGTNLAIRWEAGAATSLQLLDI